MIYDLFKILTSRSEYEKKVRNANPSTSSSLHCGELGKQRDGRSSLLARLQRPDTERGDADLSDPSLALLKGSSSSSG